MFSVLLSFITAFILTFFLIPSIIKIAIKKRLFDSPNVRSSHSVNTPSLGGLGIFAGFVFSVFYWIPSEALGSLQYILCSLILITLIGIKDDIIPIQFYKKFIGQIVIAIILIYKAKVQITNFYGLFGVEELDAWVSYILSILVIILIINSFNLIDGINGLAGSIGLIISLIFGIWFFLIDRIELSIIGFALMGSILAFLKYNFTPAKIFMGDTGSLVVGLICAILAIKFTEINLTLSSPYSVKAVPAVTLSILIIPIYDTLRVFTLRIIRGNVPFHADKYHIHHLLIDIGFSHTKATLILSVANVGFIALAYTLQKTIIDDSLTLLIIVLAVAITLSNLLSWLVRKKRAKQKFAKSN